MKKWIALICLLALCLTLCACRPKMIHAVVYLDKDLTQAEEKAIGTKLQAIEAVESCTYISREEALQDFVDQQDDPEAFSGVDTSGLRGRYEITLTRRSAIEKIEKLPGVDEVKTDEDVTDSIISALLSRAVAFFHPCAIIGSYKIRRIVR